MNDALKAIGRVIAAHDEWAESMKGLSFDDPLHDAVEAAREVLYSSQQPAEEQDEATSLERRAIASYGVARPSGSDWHLVGYFMGDDHGNWIQIPDTQEPLHIDAVRLYRQRYDGEHG